MLAILVTGDFNMISSPSRCLSERKVATERAENWANRLLKDTVDRSIAVFNSKNPSIFFFTNQLVVC